MKRMIKSFWPLVLSLSVCLFAACGDDDTPDTPSGTPDITISEVIPDLERITFTLTPTDADAYDYACVLTSVYQTGDYEMVRVESGTAESPITVDGLKAESDYTVVARAYNGSHRSATKTFATKTLAVPKVSPVLKISDTKATEKSVSFKITHTGDAASYKYAVYAKGTSAPEEFATVGAAESGAVVTVDQLTDATTYVIEAYGVIGDLVGEHVTSEFETVSLAVKVVISDIQATDARITTTMDENRCKKYYLGGYDKKNALTGSEVLDLIKQGASGIEQSLPLDVLFSKSTIDGMDLKLTPETEYVIWWVELDADESNDKEEVEALTANAIRTIEFKTIPYDLSSPATITVDVESILTQSATVKFTPSNDAVKFFYTYMEASVLQKSYASDKLLANYLISYGKQGTAALTESFSNLKAETAYAFCAMAMDADAKYSKPVTVEKTTLGYDKGSTLQFKLEQYLGKVVDPEENAVFTIDGELDNAQEIRYINISQVEFRRNYAGTDAKIENLLLSNNYPSKTILPEELTRGRMPKFTSLTSAATYYCFVMILDKDGKFTTMQKKEYETPAYDLTGTASATWELGEHWQFVDHNGTLHSSMAAKLDITPNADCTEMWVMVMDKEAYKNLAIKEVIRQAKNQDAGWYSKGTAPWTTAQKLISAAGPYNVILICKDKNGKYNDIRADIKEIESKYKDYEKPDPDPQPDPDEPGPGPKGK